MNITYDYYKIFYYVGKYGSFTGAAQMLNSSQPNITRAMNNLEAQLNVQLLNRTKRGISLTRDGERLYKKISVAMEQIRLAEEEIEYAKNYEEGICTIGASDIALYAILVPFLPDIRKKYPKISVRITNESSVSAVKNLKEGIIDFAMVTTPVQVDDGFECIEIESIQECAVVSESFGIINDKTYTLEEISRYPLIMLSQGTATRTFYNQLFGKYGIEINPQMVVGNVNQLVHLVTAGLGIGFIPEKVLDVGELLHRVRLVEPIPERKICMLYNKSSGMGRTAKLIIDELAGKLYSKNH